MHRSAFVVMAALATALASPLLRRSENADPSTASKGTVITAPLTDWIKNNHTDLQWYTTISVGTPPQNFSVLIDTGSHALLLPQSNCTSCSLTQQKFEPANSSTFSYSSRGSASPGFSTGGDTVPLATTEGATCNWVIDEVSLPSASGPQDSNNTSSSSTTTATSVSYEFLLCYQEDEALTTQPGIDGVLGLGINGSNPAALQWALLEAGVLDSGVYGLYLPSGEVSGGEITLGVVDESKFAPDTNLTWVPLNQELAAEHTQWVMDMQTIYINGEQLLINSTAVRGDPSSSPSSSSASTKNSTIFMPYPQSIIQVLDSGTSSIMAPSYAVAEALYAQISPKIYQIDPVGTWGAPCVDMDALDADITFTIGTAAAENQEGGESGPQQLLNVTIPSRVFNLGPYNSSLEDICQAVVNNWQDPLSYNGMGLWELGSPLLKNYYTAWDGLGLIVGFAPLKSTSSETLSISGSASGGRSC